MRPVANLANLYDSSSIVMNVTQKNILKDRWEKSLLSNNSTLNINLRLSNTWKEKFRSVKTQSFQPDCRYISHNIVNTVLYATISTDYKSRNWNTILRL